MTVMKNGIGSMMTLQTKKNNLFENIMKKIKVITSTTREGRRGIIIARWMAEFAKTNSEFEVELLDLKEINLPLMDEPNHPRLQKYVHQHTKNWSSKIEEADAFIITLGEYNYSIPAPIKNAIDYLFNEWQYKPLGIVSYGGISGGLRSSQMLKQVVTTINMMPLSQQVTIPSFEKLIDENNNFIPNEHIEKSAISMLKELEKWAETMQTLRK